MKEIMTEKPELKQNNIDMVKVTNRPGIQYCGKLGIVCFTGMVLVLFGFMSLSAAALSIDDLIKAHLSDNYPWENIEIGNIRVMGELGDSKPDKIAVEKGPIGKAVFAFYTSGKRVIVKANIKAYDWIVKSRRPFGKGHVLGEDDLYIEKMEIDKMPRDIVKNPEKIIGKSLKRSIAANISVVESMVEKYQMVKRGQMVKLIIGNEGFSISASGKTKEKGYVGKPVRAVNLSSKKVVTGILIDESTVKVKL
jgi:flagella basal body P-ring formation protein FlgA